MIISILHIIELFRCRVLYYIFFGCLNSYFSEMDAFLWRRHLSDMQYVCAYLHFYQMTLFRFVKSPICKRLGCGDSAAVALAAEVFSFL